MKKIMILLAVVVLVAVQALFLHSFKNPAAAMAPTLMEGDHFFSTVFFSPVHRGELVVFRFPTDDPEEVQCGTTQYGKHFIKRVIGLPGEKVEIRNGGVFIDGKGPLNEPYAKYQDPARYPAAKKGLSAEEYQKVWEARNLAKTAGAAIRDEFGPVTLPAGDYFVMGDNRDRSCDSRHWGPVPASFVKGKGWYIYWPPSRAGFLR